ncbi:MAG: hypothetical protein OHK0022_22010 [Roseiflexaceae bacterium]
MSEQPEQPVDPARPRQVPIEGAPGWVIDQRKGLFAPGATFNEKVIGYQENIHLPPPPPPMPLDQALALLEELPLDEVPPPQTLPTPQRMRSWAPNPLFVGRDHDLGRVAAQLKAGGTIAVSTGIGGVGKTQLAIEAAHRYGRYFGGGVFWLSFANPNSIPTEIADCGRAIGAFHEAERLDLDAQVQRTLARWTSDVPRLLIFDNCEDEALLRRWRPTTGGCRVLVTSRKQTAWSPDLRVTLLPLDVLPRAASVQLLQKLALRLTAEEADQIAEELGDLPLALHLAGHYLALYHSLAVESYLAKLRSPELLAHRSLIGHGVQGMPTEREPHVARAFTLSFDRLNQNDPVDVLACQFLARAACFAPGELFAQNWLKTTVTIAGDEEDQQIARTDAMNRLLALGLLEQEGDWLRLHRLLAAFTENLLSEAEALPAVEQVVNQIAALASETNGPQAMLPTLPHLRHLVQEIGEREDEVAAGLCNNLGLYLSVVGAFREALPLLKRALVIAERVLGRDHPNTAAVLNNLAELYRVQGAYEQALPLLERALAIHERVLGRYHPDTALSLNNLAALYQAQGDYEQALPLLERALVIYEQELGRDHYYTTKSLNNLAELYRVQGNYGQALPLHEQVLDIRERVLGSDHLDTAESLNNLATLLVVVGAHTRALPLLERVLEIQERRLGSNHPDTATSLNNLAYLHKSQGAYDRALPLLELALKIQERLLGSDHPDIARSLNNLAELYRAQGVYERVLSLHEQALGIRERVLGKDHPDTAQSLNNLAILHANERRFATALPLLERAICVWQARLGPQHPDTLRAQQSLAAMRRAAGIAALPEAVRTALEAQDGAAFQQILQAMPPEEARTFLQQLIEAGILPKPNDDPFAPLLQAIVAVAQGDDGPRMEVEATLAQLEQRGFHLTAAVQAIWSGQRDLATLTSNLDDTDTALIRRVLALLE